MNNFDNGVHYVCMYVVKHEAAKLKNISFLKNRRRSAAVIIFFDCFTLKHNLSVGNPLSESRLTTP
jgi:hypothetical protein